MFTSGTIRAKAKDLGFNFAGITNVEQTPHFEKFLDWLDKNQYGQLEFLQKEYVVESRRDPKQLLENAQSMIVLGVNYGPLPSKENKAALQHGKTASYAQFRDYHMMIKSKAIEFMESINDDRSKKVNYRIFIDSGQLMEKDFAFAAGLGWIGKNSLLIHPVFGSFAFLCCILTNEMVEEIPIHCEDLCKECQLCIQACPTHCISGNHTIKASQCISYLTIEYKGVIPQDLRTQIGEWVFGCDVCQSVCPCNKNVLISQSKIFFGSERKFNCDLDLFEEMGLTETTYYEKYKNTPIIRTSLEQFQRNIINAVGNSREKGYIDLLRKFISGGSEILRAQAAWALGEIDRKNCTQILKTQLLTEKSDIVIKEILNVLNNRP